MYIQIKNAELINGLNVTKLAQVVVTTGPVYSLAGGGIISRNTHWERPDKQGVCTRSRIPLYNTLLSE